MTIEGVLFKIDETKTFGNNGFRKRDVVIETPGQYPQKILVEFVQDKTDVMDQFAEGEEVEISINLRGREWVNPQGETKYFNSIQAWKIEKKPLGNENPRANSEVDKYQANQGGGSPDDPDGDLPFAPLPNY